MHKSDNQADVIDSRGLDQSERGNIYIGSREQLLGLTQKVLKVRHLDFHTAPELGSLFQISRPTVYRQADPLRFLWT